MKRTLKDMTPDERKHFETIIGFDVDFYAGTFSAGGNWDGGYEIIRISIIHRAILYLIEIGVQPE